MKSNMPYWGLLIVMLALVFLLGAVLAAAQDGTAVGDVSCSAPLTDFWTQASNVCVGAPAGYFCNGGSAPQAEPAGPVSNALAPLGALVEVKVVDAIRTSSIPAGGNGGGLAWLRLTEFIQMTGLLVGDVILRDVTPPDFPAWQSMIVETGAQPSECGAAPRNAFVAQTTPGQPIRVVVNGASLDLNGTLMVQTSPDNLSVFTMLSGQLRILAAGQTQTVYAGQQVSVPHLPGDFATPAGTPTLPQPLDLNAVRNFPVALLDRPILLPQPGYVATEGAVNLRASPSTGAPLILQAPAGEIMSVLGRNPAGDWYHVRLATGETGWMFAELLVRNVGSIEAVYESTPLPPQRLGQLAQMARVIAPMGVNLRQAPDVTFVAIGALPFDAQVELLARSPYGPWVKVNADGAIGWLALVTLETQAVIDALPIDYDVPPPPEPTRVPGSFGNAFPDPQEDGN